MVEIGKTYKVDHSRKGELIDGEVLTLRASLCRFTELEQAGG